MATGGECCVELGLDEIEYSGGRGSWVSCCCSSQPAAAAGPRKRRRVRRAKNEEEVESRRMRHIAVERNRRRLMNEYLAVLRSLMPPSYAQKGDQASIVGGAIDFVKELEQIAHSLEAKKRIKKRSNAGTASVSLVPAFFGAIDGEADAIVEAVVIERHAEIDVFARWRPRQLLRLLLWMQELRLPVLRLSVATADETVLYALNAKVEDECRFTSGEEIATALHQMVVETTQFM